MTDSNDEILRHDYAALVQRALRLAPMPWADPTEGPPEPAPVVLFEEPGAIRFTQRCTGEVIVEHWCANDDYGADWERIPFDAFLGAADAAREVIDQSSAGWRCPCGFDWLSDEACSRCAWDYNNFLDAGRRDDEGA